MTVGQAPSSSYMLNSLLRYPTLHKYHVTASVRNKSNTSWICQTLSWFRVRLCYAALHQEWAGQGQDSLGVAPAGRRPVCEP